MREAIVSILLAFWSAGFAYGAESSARFVKQFHFDERPEIIVVAEGEFEPRSMGSYSVRLYGGSSKTFPTDDFLGGLIRSRAGAVEAVKFADVDGDGTPEVVVMIRSVGTGGYLSADAFGFRTGSLILVASVSALNIQADPVEALREKVKMQKE